MFKAMVKLNVECLMFSPNDKKDFHKTEEENKEITWNKQMILRR